MREKTKKTPKNPKTPEEKHIQPYGRPKDDDLQTLFMHRLRAGKLQQIKAESLAEIACSKIVDAAPELITGRKLQKDDNYSKEKVEMVNEWFKKIDQTRVRSLWKGLFQASAAYRYKQIKSEQDFPDYLFLDQLDLSYVLHHILQSKHKELQNITQFSNFDLLYLTLACFSFRDMVSFKTLQILEDLYPQIIDNMAGLKKKIDAHYQQEKRDHQLISNQNIVNYKSEEEGESDSQDDDLRKGTVRLEIPTIEEEEERGPPKSKKIEKDKKSRGRPKKENLGELMKKPIQKEIIEDIVKHLITYISWSYSYIYPLELKKKLQMQVK